MSDLILVSVGDVAQVGFDFSESLPQGVTVASVVHSVPTGLTMGTEDYDATTSVVMVSGFQHAGMYGIKALHPRQREAEGASPQQSARR